jgi:hypothetical protein
MGDLRDHLQSIYDKNGSLEPDQVVQEARPEDHPLHCRFEWDDSIAGEHWRRHQAHELITSVRVVYRPATDQQQEITIRKYHAVRGEDERNYIYKSSEDVASNPLYSKMVLRDAERDWKTLFARYGHLKEFLELVQRDLPEASGL